MFRLVVKVEMPVYLGSTARLELAAEALKHSIEKIKTTLNIVIGIRFLKETPP